MKVLASKDAEQSVLGSVFYDESQIKLLNDKLVTDDFYYERHRHIFNAMIDLHKSQTPIDSTTVISLLEDRGQLVECGGAEYIIELTDSVPSVTNLIHYIDIVKDKAAERAVINACNDIIKKSNEGIDNTKTFLDESEKLIFNAPVRSLSSPCLLPPGERAKPKRPRSLSFARSDCFSAVSAWSIATGSTTILSGLSGPSIRSFSTPQCSRPGFIF